jgi:hypothetical protein
MYITWCPLNFLISPVACFIAHCVAGLFTDAPCSFFPSLSHRLPLPPELPLTSQDYIAEYNYARVCLRSCISKIYHVLVGAEYTTVKNPNYGNEIEEFRHGYNVWNNTSVWNWQLVKRQNRKWDRLTFLTLFLQYWRETWHIINPSRLKAHFHMTQHHKICVMTFNVIVKSYSRNVITSRLTSWL